MNVERSGILRKLPSLPVDGPACVPLTGAMRILIIIVFSGLVCAGCRHSKRGDNSMAEYESKQSRRSRATTNAPASKPLPRITPLDEISGKVAVANGSLRFVVIEFPLGTLPQLGQRMGVYRQGQKVADVKIDKWANGANVVADITAGEAREGDEVRSN